MIWHLTGRWKYKNKTNIEEYIVELFAKPLEKMTKIELIESMKIMNETHGELKKLFETEKQKYDAARIEFDQLRKENEALKRNAVLPGSKKSLKQNSDDRDQLKDILEKHRTLEKQYGELLSNFNKTKNRLDNTQDQYAELKSEFNRLLEIKKSFADNQVGHILVDYQYTIRFISDVVLERLKSKTLYDFIDQKIFKLFDYDNGMQVKKQIDRVLVKKEKGILKGTYCKACNGGLTRFDPELHATCFRDKPAVLLAFK